MKITVSEALRLKNEISNTVNKLNSEVHRAPLGITKEADVVVSNETDASKFTEGVSRLEKSLSFSEEINSKIALFNRENKIDDKVRSMHNNKLLMSVYENDLPRTKATKTNKFENLGNGVRQTITVEYIPTVTSTEVKSKISQYKTKYRTTQNEIEILNQCNFLIKFTFNSKDRVKSSIPTALLNGITN